MRIRISNGCLILFLFIWMLLHCCDPAHGHDLHVSDKPWTAPVKWVAPDVFKDAKDNYWHVYRDAEPNTLINIKLHIEETTYENKSIDAESTGRL